MTLVKAGDYWLPTDNIAGVQLVRRQAPGQWGGVLSYSAYILHLRTPLMIVVGANFEAKWRVEVDGPDALAIREWMKSRAICPLEAEATAKAG